MCLYVCADIDFIPIEAVPAQCNPSCNSASRAEAIRGELVCVFWYKTKTAQELFFDNKVVIVEIIRNSRY